MPDTISEDPFFALNQTWCHSPVLVRPQTDQLVTDGEDLGKSKEYINRNVFSKQYRFMFLKRA